MPTPVPSLLNLAQNDPWWLSSGVTLVVNPTSLKSSSHSLKSPVSNPSQKSADGGRVVVEVVLVVEVVEVDDVVDVEVVEVEVLDVVDVRDVEVVDVVLVVVVVVLVDVLVDVVEVEEVLVVDVEVVLVVLVVVASASALRVTMQPAHTYEEGLAVPLPAVPVEDTIFSKYDTLRKL